MTDALMVARALVLRDLQAHGLDDPSAVDILEDALNERQWWVDEWPEGAGYVAGLLAQDVQDGLIDAGIRRWPVCTVCDTEAEPHELRIAPDVGPDPHWVCEESGARVAALGQLS